MKISKETKIGITAVLAILIVYFGMIFLKGLKFSKSDNVYYVRMHNVNGLLVAGDVIVNGLKVGTVKAMDYRSDAQEIIVAAELDEDFFITEGSRATIHKDMLGAPKLNIILGPDSSRKLAVGDTIQGNGDAADILSAAGEMMPSIQQIIPKIDSLISALNTLANDPTLKNSLYNVEEITASLKGASVQLEGMMSAANNKIPGILDDAGVAVNDLKTTTANISQIDVNALAENAESTLETANRTLQNLEDMTASLSEKMNGTSSSLGRLLNDTTVYVHLDSTLNNASNLLLDFKEHPKRYVHFSLFGKKEK